ncbi:MAG: hypothetical protein L6V93_21470 [Clostridiales bacterium]|nr:MAG: hypothetical protein L6V93_21470 [Clostridiales bacterium]
MEVKGRMYCKDDLGNVLDEAKQSSNGQPTINITNSNDSVNTNVNGGFYGGPRKKQKLLHLFLCIIGLFRNRRFYTECMSAKSEAGYFIFLQQEFAV